MVAKLRRRDTTLLCIGQSKQCNVCHVPYHWIGEARSSHYSSIRKTDNKRKETKKLKKQKAKKQITREKGRGKKQNTWYAVWQTELEGTSHRNSTTTYFILVQSKTKKEPRGNNRPTEEAQSTPQVPAPVCGTSSIARFSVLLIQ